MTRQVRHVLTHSTGLQHAFPERATLERVCDWDNVKRVLEEAKPAWPPGTRASYHYFTYGWLVAAVVEKVTGTTFEEASACNHRTSCVAGPSPDVG